MWRSREDEEEFQNLIRRNLQQQPLFESIGNEISRDVIVDKTGFQRNISAEASGLKTDANGIPIVHKERYSKKLDCGHIAHSREDVYGICDFGHTVCSECGLKKCENCGRNICFKETVESDDDSVICTHCNRSKLLSTLFIFVVIIIITLLLMS